MTLNNCTAEVLFVLRLLRFFALFHPRQRGAMSPEPVTFRPHLSRIARVAHVPRSGHAGVQLLGGADRRIAGTRHSHADVFGVKFARPQVAGTDNAGAQPLDDAAEGASPDQSRLASSTAVSLKPAAWMLPG